jgi:hypothetical protein
VHHETRSIDAVATMSLLGVNAIADNFTFSFTDPTGTVTGEIFGLHNNATSSATEVLITSYPASLGSIKDLIATDWDAQVDNDFTETNGAIAGAGFLAEATHDPLEPTLEIDIAAVLSTNDSAVGPTTFTFAPAPVPEPFSWILLLTVMQ